MRSRNSARRDVLIRIVRKRWYLECVCRRVQQHGWSRQRDVFPLDQRDVGHYGQYRVRVRIVALLIRLERHDCKDQPERILSVQIESEQTFLADEAQ